MGIELPRDDLRERAERTHNGNELFGLNLERSGYNIGKEVQSNL